MRLPRSVFYLLFIASGFAGLIYESIWTHYLKLFLGHAAYAQSLVLGVFMGGLAIGSALCGHLSTRIRNPLLGYALVEAAIGIFALVFHALFVSLTDWSYASLLPALGEDWIALGAKLVISVAMILPPSILLGMTFPLMSAGLVRARPSRSGESVAMLYFTNSLGAAMGVLVCGFVLIAAVGLPGTLRVAGAINLLLAAVVWLLARPANDEPLSPGRDRGEGASVLLLLVALLTGLASFVYEISWIRMLSLVLGASTHAFELMLSSFILGLALGGLVVRRRVDATARPERLLGWVQVVMGLLALATLPVYDQTFELMVMLMRGIARTDEGYVLISLFGHGLSALVMLPATFLAGMTLPLITGALLRLGAGEGAIGRVYAANTLGAIAGVWIAVHAGLPLLGLKGTMVLASAVDIGIGLVLLALFAPRWTEPLLGTLAGAGCLIAVSFAFSLDPLKLSSGVFRFGRLQDPAKTQVLYQKDGKTATVHLVRTAKSTSIRTNGKSDGSISPPGAPRSADEVVAVLIGALPLALSPEARAAAVIGIGTGLTTHTLLQSDRLERVDTVEIEEAMVEAAKGFLPRTEKAFDDPRGRIVIDDAKTYFSTHDRRYDLIISEPSNPWVSGVASLFTREFYQQVQTYLNPDGLLVQWIPLYHLDPTLLASVVGALGQVFPHFAVFAASSGNLLIVGSASPIPLPVKDTIFQQTALARELASVGIRGPGDLDLRYLGSRPTLEPLFASYGAAANSDFYPVLDLNAARQQFTQRSARDLVGLLDLGIPVLEMLEPGRSHRPVEPTAASARVFQPIKAVQLARYARDLLVGETLPSPPNVPTQLQLDLELLKLRLFECRQPRELDYWLLSLIDVAKTLNPHLLAVEAEAVWTRAQAVPCYDQLHPMQQAWISLARAVGARNAPAMAELGAHILHGQKGIPPEGLEYALMAAMTGGLASNDRQSVRSLWKGYSERLGAKAAEPAFRLLRCQAQESYGRNCAELFGPYNHL